MWVVFVHFSDGHIIRLWSEVKDMGDLENIILLSFYWILLFGKMILGDASVIDVPWEYKSKKNMPTMA